MTKPVLTTKDSTEKLIKFAADELGIDLSGQERKAVIAAIKDKDASLFAKAETKPSTPDDDDSKTKEPTHYTINIHDDSGDEDEERDNFVQVGVNGVMHTVQKGVDVKVSAAIHGVLNTAIQSNFKTIIDPDTKMKTLKESKVKRWPFSVIDKHFA